MIFNKIKSHFSTQSQARQIQNLNILLGIGVGVIILYCTLIWKTTDVFKQETPTPQVILIHSDNSISNVLANPTDINTILTNKNNIDTEQYLNQNKDEKFVVGDVVIIKFFEIQGIVIKVDAPWESTVSVMYKDENRELHVLSLDRKFIARAPAGMIHLYKMDLTR